MSPDKKSGEGDDGKLMSGVAQRPKVILPEGKECKDLNGKACASFQPMCMMFPKRAHIFCKRTCKLCKEDKPDGLGLLLNKKYNSFIVLTTTSIARACGRNP